MCALTNFGAGGNVMAAFVCKTGHRAMETFRPWVADGGSAVLGTCFVIPKHWRWGGGGRRLR